MKLFFFLSYSKYHRVDKIYFYIKFRWEIWKRKNLEQYRHDFVYLTINFLHATLPGKSWRFRWRNALRIFLSSNINLSTYKLNLSTFHVSKDYCHARGNLITFYDKKTTEHEGLKRKQKEIWHKILSKHTVFTFKRGTVTNSSKYNLAEGLGLKNPNKSSFVVNDYLMSKPQWKQRKILDM